MTPELHIYFRTAGPDAHVTTGTDCWCKPRLTVTHDAAVLTLIVDHGDLPSPALDNGLHVRLCDGQPIVAHHGRHPLAPRDLSDRCQPSPVVPFTEPGSRR